MKERDIKHEAGKFWVGDMKDSYAVFITGTTHSTSESAYAHTPDGLSLAIARCEYLHKRYVANNTVHLRLTQDQMRRKTGSSGNFEGPLPLCGNGSYHCKTDSRAGHVNCEACKEIIAKRPGYL